MDNTTNEKEVYSRDFKGIWIPKKIWCDENLNITERCFMVEIDSLDNADGCFASNDYFSKFFKLSKNRCSEIIKGLEKKGYIVISYHYKEGTKSVEKRIIRVVDKSNMGIRETDRGIRETDRGYSENREDNNTIINNTINNKKHICSSNNERALLLWENYPRKVGKADALKKLPKLIEKYGYEQMERCIKRYCEVVKDRDKQYIKGGGPFFNGGYMDYLDGTTEETKQLQGEELVLAELKDGTTKRVTREERKELINRGLM